MTWSNVYDRDWLDIFQSYQEIGLHMLRWSEFLELAVEGEEGRLRDDAKHLKKITNGNQLELCQRNCERSLQMAKARRPMSRWEQEESSDTS